MNADDEGLWGLTKRACDRVIGCVALLTVALIFAWLLWMAAEGL